jgi:hypothetical protein
MKRDQPDRDNDEPTAADRARPGFDPVAWKRNYQRLYMKKLRERQRLARDKAKGDGNDQT